ncbi:hypothetical protein, partial [Cupriavidus metallidurans]|uniref:hypothetical protein n=1 Tax=Cupriavidus metallidurans TaxID=119219 RepID=UPI001BDC8EFD
PCDSQPALNTEILTPPAMFPLCIGSESDSPTHAPQLLAVRYATSPPVKCRRKQRQFINKRQFLVAMVMTGYCVQNKQ